MTSIRRALGLSFAERFILIGLNLVSYVVVARLLSPHQIGLYSVAAALVGILQVVREFGVGTYLVQVDTLTQERMNSALGVSLAMGSAAVATAWIASPFAASFYGDAEINAVLRVISLNFLLLPLVSVSQALLRRALRFDTLLHSNVLGGLAGFATTLGLAFSGTGPASLAWGSVVTNVVVAAICWRGMPEQRPRRPSFSEWRELLRFGRHSTAAAVVTTIAIDINDLVIGRVLGLAPVALISRAMGLMNMWQRDLMNAARNVALPAFAKAHREGQALEPLFLKSYAAVLVLSLPYFGFIGLFPLESLRLLAGPQWDAALPMVPAFACAGVFLSISTLIPTLMLAVGRVDVAARADIVYAVLRVLIVVCVAVLSRDMMYVALAFMVAFAASPFIFLAYKHRCVPNDLAGLIRATLLSIAVTLTALAPAAVTSFALGLGRQTPMPTLQFLGVAASVLLLWIVALKWWRHPLASDPAYERALSKVASIFRRPR